MILYLVGVVLAFFYAKLWARTFLGKNSDGTWAQLIFRLIVCLWSWISIAIITFLFIMYPLTKIDWSKNKPPKWL